MAHRPEGDEAPRHHRELRSLLRRNQRTRLSRHQADATGETYIDLLRYQFLGHRSQRQRQAQLHRRQVELNHIQFQLEQASTALDAGLLSLAERILGRTSRTPGIVLDDDVARLRSAPPRDPGSPRPESPSSTSPGALPAEGRSPAPYPEANRHLAPAADTSDGESP